MNTDNPELADHFMEFILSETFQKAIPTSNWSYPAALSDDKLPKGFKNLPKPKKGLFLGEVEAEKIRKKIGIDIDVKPETVTEENLAPVTPTPEAKKEEASKVETKTEKKLENTPEKK